MLIFAVTNQKGGSGKTTTAVNLGAALGERGKRVLLVDLDSQASASSWLGVNDAGKEILEVFTEGRDLLSLVRETAAPGVDLIAASSWLVGVEKAMAGEVGGETIFRKALAALPRGRWDFVLMDCPPSLGFLALSALVAAHEVLVPVETRVMALKGMADLVRTVERIQERLNPKLELSAVLACRVDSRTNLSGEVVDRLRSRFGKRVLKAMVRENVRLAEAPSFAQPITVYAPGSAGAEDYRAVAQELLGRISRKNGARKKSQRRS